MCCQIGKAQKDFNHISLLNKSHRDGAPNITHKPKVNRSPAPFFFFFFFFFLWAEARIAHKTTSSWWTKSRTSGTFSHGDSERQTEKMLFPPNKLCTSFILGASGIYRSLPYFFTLFRPSDKHMHIWKMMTKWVNRSVACFFFFFFFSH